MDTIIDMMQLGSIEQPHLNYIYTKTSKKSICYNIFFRKSLNESSKVFIRSEYFP